MKKFAVILASFALCVSALAVTDHVDYTLVVSSGTTNSASAAYTVHGIVQGVYVDVPSAAVNSTSVVLITSAQGQTILTKTVSSDTYFPVRAQINTTSGAAAGDSLIGATNAIYDRIAVSGLLTARTAGTSADTNSATTAIRLIYEK